MFINAFELEIFYRSGIHFMVDLQLVTRSHVSREAEIKLAETFPQRLKAIV